MTQSIDPMGEPIAASLTWMLDTFVTPFVEASKRKLEDMQEQRRWIRALASYKESLLRHYGTLRVLGNNEDVPLVDVFTDVHVLEQLTAQRRFDLREMLAKQIDREQLHYHTMERKSGLGLINQGNNLYILGKPGAGKTTFLKWVTTRCINGKLTNPRLPVFVSLHEWSNSQHEDLLTFVLEQFDIHQFPDAGVWMAHLLVNGQALFLFDGLDEVRKENNQRADVSLRIRRFTKKYDRNQFLVTCRVAASEYDFPNFQIVEMADFTDEQVKSYAKKWFRDQDIKYKAFVNELDKNDNQGLRELCNVPLLLSMLCLYFDETMTFPERRAELYEDALDALLRKWDSSRQIQRDSIYQSLSHKRKQQMLSSVATPAFEEGRYFFSTRQLADALASYLSNLPGTPESVDIDGDAVLRAVEAQHGVLVERAKNIHSFSHLSFQEYFTARYIADNEARGATTSLIREHLADLRWREIFLLTVSMLSNAEDFLDEMRAQIINLVSLDASVVQMLRWANEKSISSQHSDSYDSVIRLMYFALEVILDLTLDSSLQLASERSTELVNDLLLSIAAEYDVESEYVLAHAQALHLARSLARIRSRTLDRMPVNEMISSLANPIDLVHSLDLSRALDLASSLDPAVGTDFALYYSWSIATILANLEHFKKRRILYQRSWFRLHALCNLNQDLALLKPISKLHPPRTPDRGVWSSFADDLWHIMEAQRGFYLFHSLSFETFALINTFLSANQLFVRCLNLAYVGDRHKALNSLMLGP